MGSPLTGAAVVRDQRQMEFGRHPAPGYQVRPGGRLRSWVCSFPICDYGGAGGLELPDRIMNRLLIKRIQLGLGDIAFTEGLQAFNYFIRSGDTADGFCRYGGVMRHFISFLWIGFRYQSFKVFSQDDSV